MQNASCLTHTPADVCGPTPSFMPLYTTKTKASKQNKPGAASQLVHFLYLILPTIQSCLFWASILKDTLNDYLPKHTHNVLWSGSANHLLGMLKGIVQPEGSTGEVWGSRQAMHKSDQKSSVKGCGGQAVEVRLWRSDSERCC